MSPRGVGEMVRLEPPLLHVDETIERAVARLLESDLPALPVVDERERYAGIFGEREFMTAIFPGYVRQLRYAGFVSRPLDEALHKREACRQEPVGRYMNAEHVDVGPDFSDVQVAEIFFHHRVLIVPVVDEHRVNGLITRHDFFQAVAARFLDKLS